MDIPAFPDQRRRKLESFKVPGNDLGARPERDATSVKVSSTNSPGSWVH